jgi:hypothetical protein
VQQNRTQRNEIQTDVSNILISQTQMSKIRKKNLKWSEDTSSSLKDHYHFRFVQSSYQSSSNVLCNYYCKLDHILIKYIFRKGKNKVNVIWIPKSKE